MNCIRLVIFLVVALICFPAVAIAHDFFLYPSAFYLHPGDSVRLFTHVSDTFPGVPQNWNPDRVVRFVHISNGRITDRTNIARQDSPRAAVVALRDTGTHLFALDWKARLIELKPDQFVHYLQSEGLDRIIGLRKKRGETDKPGREQYSRYVKTLVQVGSEVSTSISKVVGQKIEIVPLENPYKLTIGDSFAVQVLFDGKPLPDALISATYAGFTKRADTYEQSVRTDERGTAVFHLTHRGPWLVRVVQMVPLENSADADWESFWASLTFEIAE